MIWFYYNLKKSYFIYHYFLKAVHEMKYIFSTNLLLNVTQLKWKISADETILFWNKKAIYALREHESKYNSPPNISKSLDILIFFLQTQGINNVNTGNVINKIILNSKSMPKLKAYLSILGISKVRGKGLGVRQLTNPNLYILVYINKNTSECTGRKDLQNVLFYLFFFLALTVFSWNFIFLSLPGV